MGTNWRKHGVADHERFHLCEDKLVTFSENISTESNKKFLAKNGFFFRWYMLG
ncbi:uncharacterized protein RSE6_09993 [Rhynchosporium secalis]|uniref:Uncharacterized protein n=1 Tax=Rhynchosporium secalis TaxID=38038 RepID=A0A1E1MJD3_RHYSE|nr:uncharacterized protein RSE6_09993 [Rhynchosporium secalis]